MKRNAMAAAIVRCVRIIAILHIILLLAPGWQSPAGAVSRDILTPEERQWLTGNLPRITLALETVYAPFVFQDSKGAMTGLAHEFMESVQAKLGVTFQQKRFATLDLLLEKVRGGGPYVVNALTKTPQRSQYLTFTDPYVSIPNVIITLRSRTGRITEKDLAGWRVALVKSYAVTEYMTSRHLGFEPHLVDDDLSALLSVSFGQNDAAVIDLATASYLISNKGINNLRVAGETAFYNELAMGTRIDQPELASILRKGLASITSEERSAIHHRWINADRSSLISDRRVVGAISVALMIICTITAAVFGWNRTLKRQVEIRTDALKQEKEALKKSEERFRKLFHDHAAVKLVINPETGDIMDANRSASSFYGWSIEELRKMNICQINMLPPEEIRQKLKSIQSRSCSSFEFRHRLANGSIRDVSSYSNIIELDGKEQIYSIVQDITVRKNAEKAYNEISECFSAAFRNAPLMMCITSLESEVFLDVNQRFLDVTGYTRDEVVGRTNTSLCLLPPTDRQNLKRRLAHDVDVHDVEVNITTKAGQVLLCKYWGEVLNVGDEPRLLSISLDVTEHRRIEQQLLHAQKMESVGRLAGGVAHDFNNMLVVILGHAELALNKMDSSSALRHHLEEIFDAANRSAEITRQLLAFARRQAVEPRLIDINDTIKGLLKMLGRLIREDVELVWTPGSGSLKIRIDPSQLDQIMANLCVNARDAITGVGRIDITTDRIKLEHSASGIFDEMEPGEYVVLVVSDNGCGMTRDVLDHIFEPFYTTKEFGKGTGLGLATVFGIVSQNGGHIKVYSEPEHGTVFRIYFPAVEVPAEHVPERSPATLSRGSETVLLVEDESAILQMATAMLSELGYTVLAADSPERALKLARNHHQGFSLLVTDIIMPGMNGRDLANLLKQEMPELKCLFMSGYTADVMSSRGNLDEHAHFLQKPFTMQSLSAKVREALEG